MKLFGLNISRTQPEHRKEYPLSEIARAWLSGGQLPACSCTNLYEQVVWVYRAVNVLAEQVANIPFLFSAGERGRENLITRGPLHDFYRSPHPLVNRFQYWELRVMWLMLRGECMRIPVFERDSKAPRGRRLARVLMPDPARMRHVIRDNRLAGWEYLGAGPQDPHTAQVFLPEEVWFERLPNPFDPWRGLAPLHVATHAARTDFSAAALMRGLIEHNGDMGMIVRSTQALDPDQVEQMLHILSERRAATGIPDRPLFLPQGVEVVPPHLSSSDLQFLENRKFSRAEICAAFGVPEEILTSTDTAKYDVMEGARLNFVENRVGPLCARLEAAEEATVQAIDPAACGWFDLDSLPIMQHARRTRLAAAKTGFDMGVPINELNRLLDLGFKPLPWGDRGYLAANLRRTDTALDSSPKPTAPNDRTGEPLLERAAALRQPQSTKHNP
jgi:HK97 family phage portal protein